MLCGVGTVLQFSVYFIGDLLLQYINRLPGLGSQRPNVLLVYPLGAHGQ